MQEKKWSDEDIIEAVMRHSGGCTHGKEAWLSSLGIPTEVISERVQRPVKEVYRVSVVLEIPVEKMGFDHRDGRPPETEQELFRFMAKFFPKWAEPAPPEEPEHYLGASANRRMDPQTGYGARWVKIRVEAVNDED